MEVNHPFGQDLALSHLVEEKFIKVIFSPLLALHVLIDLTVVLLEQPENQRWSRVNQHLGNDSGYHPALVLEVDHRHGGHNLRVVVLQAFVVGFKLDTIEVEILALRMKI